MINSIIFDASYTLVDLGARVIYPDVEPTLKILKKKGYNLYLVSNWSNTGFERAAGLLRDRCAVAQMHLEALLQWVQHQKRRVGWKKDKGSGG